MGKVITLPCVKISSMPDIELDLSSIKVSKTDVYKVTCFVAGDEYTQVIAPPVKRITILSAGGFLDFSINGTDFVKIMPASAFEVNMVDDEKTLTIKLKSSKANDIIQIVSFN